MRRNARKPHLLQSRRNFIRSAGFIAGNLALTPPLLPQVFRQHETILPSGDVLPDGVRAVWDLAAAYREATPTRERICINGLWQWQPAAENAAEPPAADSPWGYFKVPGPWPQGGGARNDHQVLYGHPAWSGARRIHPGGLVPPADRGAGRLEGKAHPAARGVSQLPG
jgi:hypothetical protein